MRQFHRNQMRRNGISFGGGANKIVASYVKDGRKYELHATKGWRSFALRFVSPYVNNENEVKYEFVR